MNKLENKLDDFDTDIMLMEDKEMPSFQKKHGKPLILVRMKVIIDKLTKPIQDLEEVVQRVIKATETLTNTSLTDDEGDRSVEQRRPDFF